MGTIKHLAIILSFLFAFHALAEDSSSENLLSVDSGEKSIWVDGIGSGYVKKARILDFQFTRGFGSTNYGGFVSHDLLLGTLIFGQSFNEVWAPNKWYGGNLFWTGEVVGGVQDDPDVAYLIFGNMGLRYEFATQWRLIPYVDGAMGAGATAVGAPDLSEGVQFLTRVGIGARYYFTERFSASVGLGYMHISNGGYKKPNGGINSYMIKFGVGWSL